MKIKLLKEGILEFETTSGTSGSLDLYTFNPRGKQTLTSRRHSIYLHDQKVGKYTGARPHLLQVHFFHHSPNPRCLITAVYKYPDGTTIQEDNHIDLPTYYNYPRHDLELDDHGLWVGVYSDGNHPVNSGESRVWGTVVDVIEDRFRQHRLVVDFPHTALNGLILVAAKDTTTRVVLQINRGFFRRYWTATVDDRGQKVELFVRARLPAKYHGRQTLEWAREQLGKNTGGLG